MAYKLFEVLKPVKLNNSHAYLRPLEQPLVVHMDDDALNVLTDFSFCKPFIISPDEKLPQATTEMKAAKVHSLLVVDQNDQVIGLITSEDILSEKPVKVTHDKFISHQDIKVRSIMQAIHELAAIDIETIKHSKIGNLVHTFIELKQPYLLVVEHNSKDKNQQIRGIISARKLGEQLGMDILENMVK